jgi:ribosomal protein S13
LRQLTDDAPLSISDLARQWANEDEMISGYTGQAIARNSRGPNGFKNYRHRRDSRVRGGEAGRAARWGSKAAAA